MRLDPLATAVAVLKNKYPGAAFGFASGSVFRGEGTAASDIDLVVLFDSLENAWREAFVVDGWPIETFVHDSATLRYFFEEVDCAEGIPSLVSMVAEGAVVPARTPLSDDLQVYAQKIIAESKPPAWSEETITQQRYFITDLVDDIRDPRNLLEARAVVGALHESLGNFYFRSRQEWSANRKHIPRRLLKVNPELSERWSVAFADAFAGECAAVIALAGEILRPYGGFCFDGYRRDAPANWRK